MEAYSLDFLFGGLTVASLAWVWLIGRAFQQRIWWGLSCLVLPPVALAFALRHAQKAVGPLVLLVVGITSAIAAPLYSILGPVDLKLRERLSEGPKVWSLAKTLLQSDAAHEWMESRAFYMQLGGLAVAALAAIWLLFHMFRHHRPTLVSPPPRFRSGVILLLLVALSLAVAAAPALYTLYVPLNLGEREKTVDGHSELTLTGWDRKDYSILKLKPNVVVLHMANPDVTDETLASLKAMELLEELDLSDTHVTDAGLKLIKDLPALARLFLARTNISDEGFRNALFAKDSLMRLDVTGTQVSRETLQSWRNAKPGRRAIP
jgi:hypothetical protein